MKKFPAIIITFLLLLILSADIFAQPSKVLSASEIKLALQKLSTLGSVLYVAAHPDDENTAVLSYYSSKELFRTGYLSVTRGDGGQNLIGSEQAELLGVIRTQELIEARKIDGAEQFFTRAIDFGYSKSPDETLRFWNKDKMLEDYVWIIRKFRPDIIITRFPVSGIDTHGHHTASAILAAEAFKIAGDPKIFPEQLKYVNPWQPKRIFWNAWLPWLQQQNAELTNLLSIDVGEFNPLLGKSYSEISALSRSMHKSQGFGASGRRSELLNYFELIDGTEPVNNLFDGIDISWNRVEGSETVAELLKEAEEKFNPLAPSEILPILFDAYRHLENINEDFWVTQKKKELKNVIFSCAGLWIEAIAEDFASTSGGSVTVNAGIVNRSEFPLSLKEIRLTFAEAIRINEPLTKGKFFEQKMNVNLPESLPFTQPYWLEQPFNHGSFNLTDQKLIGKAENDPVIQANFILSSDYGDISFTTPLLFRWTDPVEGEKYRPFVIVPDVTINFKDNIYLFPDNSERQIFVTLKNNSDSANGILNFDLPSEWKISPNNVAFEFSRNGQESIFSFTITPPPDALETILKAEVIIRTKKYDRGMITISYPHIQTQTIFPPAETKLIRLNTNKIISKVGYIMGSGDAIPSYLSQLGYEVIELSDMQLHNNDLREFDAIITGIRAYNTRENLSRYHPKLLDYINNGGTLVVQYNVNRGMHVDNPGPFPFTISRNRVTDESAPVRFTKPEHLLLNYPNQITEKDFDGWIQERGLYYAGEWSDEYETVISINDPGEEPKEGSLLFAIYGKGVFIYTGESWFRQLPAGVAGAYRFFVNLISSGKALREYQKNNRIAH